MEAKISHEKEIRIETQSLKAAEKIAKSFFEEYRNGPYADELSTNRVRFFYFTRDFEAGLNNALFWEFKRLGLWHRIRNKDWDDAVKLSMERAYEYLVALEPQDTMKKMKPNS